MQKTGKAGIYFHVPFCSRKCPYCHFYVIPHRKELEKQFLETLKREWHWREPLLANKEILTLYFGGGTPSLLEAAAFAELIEMTQANPKEVTLEVNPETVSLEKMIAFKKAGINRISIGVQSLDNAELALLGRNHAAQKAIDAVKTTAEAGFENITIDLMFELPTQTLASWERTLTQAARLPITHLSLYNLTFEPHTPFHKRQKELTALLPADEVKLKMLEMAIETLESAGFHRYEISAFAKEGFASLHNTGYWQARPFLGFGPSAFSYWDKKRFRNASSLEGWAKALAVGNSPVDFEEELAAEDSFNELLAIELRLLSGVDLAAKGPLPARTNATLSTLEQEGFLFRQNTKISLTEKGRLFYDSVASEII